MNYLTAAETVTGVISRAISPRCLQAHILSERDMQSLHDVARWLVAGAVSRGETVRSGDRLPTVNLEALEAAAIKQALADTGGHKVRACELLGINESTLYRIINGISPGKWGRPKGTTRKVSATASLATGEG